MSVQTYRVSREGDRLLSPHFRVREFACRDGSDLVKIDTDLVELLERIRAAAGGAVTISSGYRTASHNQKVGGARYSQHLLGTAADIVVSGAGPLLVGQMAEYYLGSRGGIGVYQTFTHVDTRSGKARWDQRSGREVAVSGWPGWRPKEDETVDNIPSAYAEEAVDWAVKNDLLQGNAAGDLMLRQPVTRQQLAALLFRFAQSQGMDVSVGEDTNILSYPDAFDAAEYAVPALQWACGAGVLYGTSDGRLDPQGTATRAQFAVMLERFWR